MNPNTLFLQLNPIFFQITFKYYTYFTIATSEIAWN